MKKRSTILLFAAVFFSFLLTGNVYAQDSNDIRPILTSQDVVDNSGPLILAQGTQNSSDSELDAELMAEYGDDDLQKEEVPDPFYYFNLTMFTVHDVLYTIVINPVTTVYEAVTPTIVRKGVRNFFHNLMFPVRFVNNLLQGKFSDAGTEVEIFVVNTTAGVAGFGQVAQNHFDLHTSDEDLGQTLGSYDINEGFYLFIPVLGPTTLRDGLGMVGDYFLTPVNYVDPWELQTGLKAYEGVNKLSFHLGEYEELKGASVDPYTAIKNAYIQNRNKKIKE